MKKLLIVVALAFVGCGASTKEAASDPDGGYIAPASVNLMMLPGEIVHDPGPGTDPPPPPN